jgi:quercetin dioxygenase-like cupin family protein
MRAKIVGSSRFERHALAEHGRCSGAVDLMRCARLRHPGSIAYHLNSLAQKARTVMATPRAAPGDLIDVRPFGPALKSAKSVTLMRSDHIEVMRLVIPAGKRIPEHRVPGEMTVQCLEGSLKFGTDVGVQTMHAGDLLFTLPGQAHWLEALEDASVLVSLYLPQGH